MKKCLTRLGFAWQSALKMTRPVKLELLKNARLHDAFENAVRGGVSSVMNRFAAANQPDLPGYDPTKPRREMIYLDAVNLVSILNKIAPHSPPPPPHLPTYKERAAVAATAGLFPVVCAYTNAFFFYSMERP